MTRGMIQLSPRGKVVYQFLNLTVALLLLYAACMLLAALNQLPAPPLEAWAVRLDNLAEQSFELLLLTGFLAAGLMLAGESLGVPALDRWRLIWLAFVGATLALSALGQSQLAEGLTAVALLAALAWSRRSGGASTCLSCWRIGLLLIALSSALASFEVGDLSPALTAFRVQVAFALCSLSILFWLIPRYSRLSQDWAQSSLRITAVLVFLGGSLISLGRLGLPEPVSLAATPLIAISYILLASHSARALRNRDENASLAPHWIALATLFWLVGGGFLGALSIQPGIAQAVRGTDLAAAQHWLGGWVNLAIALGFVNEAAAALRGDNQRVTGYMPYWLMGFGVGLASILQVCRGLLQVYLRELAALEPAAEAELLLPLTSLWLLCLLAAAAGMALYAIGFWLRQPRIRVIDG